MKKRDTAAVLPGFSTARTPAKLDTTGLTGKDRILMLAEIIKAHEAGRVVELRHPGYDGTWTKVPHPDFDSIGNYRIRPISRTVYVNLYYDGIEREWLQYPTESAAKHAASQGDDAFAVAVPVTIEE